MSIPCHLKRILSTTEQVLPMRTSETPQQCYCTCKLSWQITYSNCCRLSASLIAPGKSQLIEWKHTIILLEPWGEIPSSWRTSISQEISWEMLTMLLDTDRQNSAEFSRKSSFAQRLETEDSNKKIINSSSSDEEFFSLNLCMFILFLSTLFCLFTYSAYSYIISTECKNLNSWFWVSSP